MIRCAHKVPRNWVHNRKKFCGDCFALVLRDQCLRMKHIVLEMRKSYMSLYQEFAEISQSKESTEYAESG